jgi:AcrR family transcriptional regulator
MPSQRHTPTAVLDAVRSSVLAVGVRRTTLTDVAKRAGLSRMTLYRRYPDVRALLRELMTREFGALLRAARDAGRVGGHARGRLVATAVAAVGRLRDDELFRRILEVDPELLMPYVLDRIGGTQRLAAEFLADAIASGQADGSIRGGDTQRLSYTVLLLVQPFVYSGRTVIDVLDAAGLDSELGAVLDRYLAP